MAVHPLEGRGVEIEEATLDAMTRQMEARFAEAAGVQILSHEKVRAHLQSRGLYICFGERACQMDVERALGADYTLALAVLPMGKICVVNGTLYERDASMSLRMAMARGDCSEASLREGVRSVVDKLAAKGPLPMPAPRSAPGETPEPAAGEQAEEGRRPDFFLGASLVYAPAPYITDELDSFKWYDQFGPRLFLDMRFFDHLLAGLQADLFFDKDDWLLEVAGRVGGQIAFGDLYLHGLGSLGLSYWDGPGEGLHLGACLGLRYMLKPFLGLTFELAGAYNWYDESGLFYEMSMLRLEITAGVVFQL
ncbi:MAG: hypothetical protein JXR96_16865 [Deltaproteobacteria bacterium]|nr:hypothetical protein [Deltaproteobacteria bacterium]